MKILPSVETAFKRSRPWTRAWDPKSRTPVHVDTTVEIKKLGERRAVRLVDYGDLGGFSFTVQIGKDPFTKLDKVSCWTAPVLHGNVVAPLIRTSRRNTIMSSGLSLVPLSCGPLHQVEQYFKEPLPKDLVNLLCSNFWQVHRILAFFNGFVAKGIPHTMKNKYDIAIAVLREIEALSVKRAMVDWISRNEIDVEIPAEEHGRRYALYKKLEAELKTDRTL